MKEVRFNLSLKLDEEDKASALGIDIEGSTRDISALFITAMKTSEKVEKLMQKVIAFYEYTRKTEDKN